MRAPPAPAAVPRRGRSAAAAAAGANANADAADADLDQLPPPFGPNNADVAADAEYQEQELEQGQEQEQDQEQPQDEEEDYGDDPEDRAAPLPRAPARGRAAPRPRASFGALSPVPAPAVSPRGNRDHRNLSDPNAPGSGLTPAAGVSSGIFTPPGAHAATAGVGAALGGVRGFSPFPQQQQQQLQQLQQQHQQATASAGLGGHGQAAAASASGFATVSAAGVSAAAGSGREFAVYASDSPAHGHPAHGHSHSAYGRARAGPIGAAGVPAGSGAMMFASPSSSVATSVDLSRMQSPPETPLDAPGGYLHFSQQQLLQQRQLHAPLTQQQLLQMQYTQPRVPGLGALGPGHGAQGLDHSLQLSMQQAGGSEAKEHLHRDLSASFSFAAETPPHPPAPAHSHFLQQQLQQQQQQQQQRSGSSASAATPGVNVNLNFSTASSSSSSYSLRRQQMPSVYDVVAAAFAPVTSPASSSASASASASGAGSGAGAAAAMQREAEADADAAAEAAAAAAVAHHNRARSRSSAQGLLVAHGHSAAHGHSPRPVTPPLGTPPTVPAAGAGAAHGHYSAHGHPAHGHPARGGRGAGGSTRRAANPHNNSNSDGYNDQQLLYRRPSPPLDSADRNRDRSRGRDRMQGDRGLDRSRNVAMALDANDTAVDSSTGGFGGGGFGGGGGGGLGRLSFGSDVFSHNGDGRGAQAHGHEEEEEEGEGGAFAPAHGHSAGAAHGPQFVARFTPSSGFATQARRPGAHGPSVAAHSHAASDLSPATPPAVAAAAHGHSAAHGPHSAYGHAHGRGPGAHSRGRTAAVPASAASSAGGGLSNHGGSAAVYDSPALSPVARPRLFTMGSSGSSSAGSAASPAAVTPPVASAAAAAANAHDMSGVSFGAGSVLGSGGFRPSRLRLSLAGDSSFVSNNSSGSSLNSSGGLNNSGNTIGVGSASVSGMGMVTPSARLVTMGAGDFPRLVAMEPGDLPSPSHLTARARPRSRQQQQPQQSSAAAAAAAVAGVGADAASPPSPSMSGGGVTPRRRRPPTATNAATSAAASAGPNAGANASANALVSANANASGRGRGRAFMFGAEDTPQTAAQPRGRAGNAAVHVNESVAVNAQRQLNLSAASDGSSDGYSFAMATPVAAAAVASAAAQSARAAPATGAGAGGAAAAAAAHGHSAAASPSFSHVFTLDFADSAPSTPAFAAAGGHGVAAAGAGAGAARAATTAAVPASGITPSSSRGSGSAGVGARASAGMVDLPLPTVTPYRPFNSNNTTADLDTEAGAEAEADVAVVGDEGDGGLASVVALCLATLAGHHPRFDPSRYPLSGGADAGAPEYAYTAQQQRAHTLEQRRSLKRQLKQQLREQLAQQQKEQQQQQQSQSQASSERELELELEQQVEAELASQWPQQLQQLQEQEQDAAHEQQERLQEQEQLQKLGLDQPGEAGGWWPLHALQEHVDQLGYADDGADDAARLRRAHAVSLLHSVINSPLARAHRRHRGFLLSWRGELLGAMAALRAHGLSRAAAALASLVADCEQGIERSFDWVGPADADCERQSDCERQLLQQRWAPGELEAWGEKELEEETKIAARAPRTSPALCEALSRLDCEPRRAAWLLSSALAHSHSQTNAHHANANTSVDSAHNVNGFAGGESETKEEDLEGDSLAALLRSIEVTVVEDESLAESSPAASNSGAGSKSGSRGLKRGRNSNGKGSSSAKASTSGSGSGSPLYASQSPYSDADAEPAGALTRDATEAETETVAETAEQREQRDTEAFVLLFAQFMCGEAARTKGVLTQLSQRGAEPWNPELPSLTHRLCLLTRTSPSALTEDAHSRDSGLDRSNNSGSDSSSDSPFLLYLLALCLAARGLRAPARRLLCRSLTLFPLNLSAWHLLLALADPPPLASRSPAPPHSSPNSGLTADPATGFAAAPLAVPAHWALLLALAQHVGRGLAVPPLAAAVAGSAVPLPLLSMLTGATADELLVPATGDNDDADGANGGKGAVRADAWPYLTAPGALQAVLQCMAAPAPDESVLAPNNKRCPLWGAFTSAPPQLPRASPAALLPVPQHHPASALLSCWVALLPWSLPARALRLWLTLRGADTDPATLAPIQDGVALADRSTSKFSRVAEQKLSRGGNKLGGHRARVPLSSLPLAPATVPFFPAPHLPQYVQSLLAAHSPSIAGAAAAHGHSAGASGVGGATTLCAVALAAVSATPLLLHLHSRALSTATVGRLDDAGLAAAVTDAAAAAAEAVAEAAEAARAQLQQTEADANAAASSAEYAQAHAQALVEDAREDVAVSERALQIVTAAENTKNVGFGAGAAAGASKGETVAMDPALTLDTYSNIGPSTSGDNSSNALSVSAFATVTYPLDGPSALSLCPLTAPLVAQQALSGPVPAPQVVTEPVYRAAAAGAGVGAAAGGELDWQWGAARWGRAVVDVVAEHMARTNPISPEGHLAAALQSLLASPLLPQRLPRVHSAAAAALELGLGSALSWRLLALSIDDAAAPVLEAYAKAAQCAPLDYGAHLAASAFCAALTMWPRALYHARSAAALAPYESEVWLSVAHCVSGMRGPAASVPFLTRGLQLGDRSLALSSALLTAARCSLSSAAVLDAVQRVEARFPSWPALLAHPVGRRAFALHCAYALQSGDATTAAELAAALAADAAGAYAGVGRDLAPAAVAMALVQQRAARKQELLQQQEQEQEQDQQVAENGDAEAAGDGDGDGEEGDGMFF